MGHALLAMALPGVDPVQKISIIPRGIAGLGYTVLSSPSCWLRWWLGSCWLGPWRMGSRWKAAPWMGAPSLVMQVSSESAELPDERPYNVSIALGERPRLLTARRHTPHCISDIVSN
jgi:hypothetical protein